MGVNTESGVVKGKLNMPILAISDNCNSLSMKGGMEEGWVREWSTLGQTKCRLEHCCAIYCLGAVVAHTQ